MSSKIISFIKVPVNIIMIVALVWAFIVIDNFDKQNAELNKANNELSNSIIAKENVINKLSDNNKELASKISSLEDANGQLKDANNELQSSNGALETRIQELLNQIKKLEDDIAKIEKENEKENAVINPPYRDFKSYMSYKAITSRSSRQWKLQQQATTNEDGIRCIDGIPLVAVGTGWGLSVGDIAIVTCDNGNSFKVMIGDIKSDKHTDAEHKTSGSGCRCEFIVDIDKLDSKVRLSGNMSTLDKYKGYVVNIEKAS